MGRQGKAIEAFHPAVRAWFEASFEAPTSAQALGWPAIARGESTLILAPTGGGKTLAAFLWCINRLMFEAPPSPGRRCRVLYVSPLKALAVDVERNLRAPIAGIARVAGARGDAHQVPTVAIRTGDTPQSERARFRREPSDILITTPESLYLMLTSAARDALRGVDTAIVDEIHALVPTKRGAHLAVSLERLEELTGGTLQRVGLSATQRPLEEVARFLGGVDGSKGSKGSKGSRGSKGSIGSKGSAAGVLHDEFAARRAAPAFRPVAIVDTGERKRLELRIEVPVEDMARLAAPDIPGGPASLGPSAPSIWSAIHPRLLELVRAHRTTLIFVNSRRLAERMAAALNELAGDTLVRSHHGSLAREQRLDVEDRLKAGALRGLVATSSLELGIDMGAVDLVVQIEAPPSVASGMQRIGRAGHQIDAPSRGVIFPKYRGDLVACAAVTRAMREGRVEASRYPRNPLDVLAQHIVSMTSTRAWGVDGLFALVRQAAPYAELSRAVFEGVLDMLAGRYPSDEFAELKPRVTWDRVKGTVEAREGAARVAVANAGTIPDRGLYGVFLAGAGKGAARVGELDEEMVHESRVGETFLLGASTWRIEEITHDRVMVSPAPGEPGKMPFWKGEGAGRPLELGREIGTLVRTLRQLPAPAAIDRLVRDHDLDRGAAENLVAYLREQEASGAVPDEQTLVIERVRDELGDWRVCVLSPLGGRVHAPWSLAVTERLRRERDLVVETMWSDDGFVIRFPDSDAPPDTSLVLIDPDEVEPLVVSQLGASSLFAAKFRESAARALLLPRRRAAARTPLWQQRKRAADLLAVAARYGSFPIVLEAYRECLRDVFDMPALVETMRLVRDRRMRAITLDSETPSPFAGSLLFGYVANFLYDGDAPLAERRAQALAIDQSQLRELLGGAELRELLDADAIDELERQRQHLEARARVRSADALHDALLRLGDLNAPEIAARSAAGFDAADATAALAAARRLLPVRVAGDRRWIPVEYAARYRDALGVPLPAGVPESLLAPAPHALADLARRFARTHGPFTAAQFAGRYGLGAAIAHGTLAGLMAAGQLLEGAFRPGGREREWCDPENLAIIRRRSLARLRKQVEPVEPRALGRLLASWQGAARPRRGLDALLDSIELLQGAPVAASVLEREILPARVDGYSPADLDALMAAGEVVWTGVDPLGERDGRVALFLADSLPRLWAPRVNAEDLGPRERAILEHLEREGASFFPALHEAAGGGYPADTVGAIWTLVWSGLVTNDTPHALRAYLTAGGSRDRKAARAGTRFRSRRTTPASAEGRWSLVEARAGRRVSPTERAAALAQQLLARYGVLTREAVTAEGIPGGFSSIYEVLKTLEDTGRVRRGYFIAGLAATQFAVPPALDLLRSLRDEPQEPEAIALAATDPANPYGALLKWPFDSPAGSTSGLAQGKPTRTVGASVLIVNGALAAFIGRGGRQILSSLPGDEPARSVAARALAARLADIAREGKGRGGGLLVTDIDAVRAEDHPLGPYLRDAGFVSSAMGMLLPRPRREIRGTVTLIIRS
ncbi:MAG: DEAD/DEAH box helicase [Acidobacteria bacterium]|nr:DEAD/DEAH box helicase [Acidobacteriota bacterium]